MNENRLICRGKREDTGKWVEGYYVRLEGIDSPLHIIIDRAGQHNRVLPETVGECTGCLDVQGRLIFEDDLIKNRNNEYIVSWNKNRSAFIGQIRRKMDYELLDDILNVYGTEIIGNIHEVINEEQGQTKAATEEAEAGVHRRT